MQIFFHENKSLAPKTPLKQADYFAYRMWYYVGGNMRMLKDHILRFNITEHAKFFGKNYV